MVSEKKQYNRSEIVISEEIQALIANEDISLAECLEICIKENNPREFYFRMGFDKTSLLTGVLFNESIDPLELKSFILDSDDREQISYEFILQLTNQTREVRQSSFSSYSESKTKNILMINDLMSNPSEKSIKKLDILCKILEKVEDYDTRLEDKENKTGMGSVIYGENTQRLLYGLGNFQNSTSFLYDQNINESLAGLLGEARSIEVANKICRAIMPLREAVKKSFQIECSLFKSLRASNADLVNNCDLGISALKRRDISMSKHRDQFIQVMEIHMNDLANKDYSLRHRDMHLLGMMPEYDLRSPLEHDIFDEWARAIVNRLKADLTKTTAQKIKGMSLEPDVILNNIAALSKKMYSSINPREGEIGEICAINAAAFIPKYSKLMKSASRSSIRSFKEDFSKKCDWSAAIKLGGKRLENSLVEYLGASEDYIGLLSKDSRRKLLADDLSI